MYTVRHTVRHTVHCIVRYTVHCIVHSTLHSTVHCCTRVARVLHFHRGCGAVRAVRGCQVVGDMPEGQLTKHDVPVDIIVTPTRVIRVGKVCCLCR